MSGLELIIRPFLPRDVRPIPVPIANAKVTGPVSLTFGAKPGATVFEYSQFLTINFSAQIEYQETARDVVTKRIKNPQDPDQYVDVEVIKKITFKDKNDPKATKYPYNLNEFGGTPP
jgi:hypothetical protein